MQFPDPRGANFLMVCVFGSAAAYVYEPHPRCAPSSPHVSRADGAGESPCPPSVARECPRANAEHDWRVVSSVYGVPPFSQPRCRSASLSCDGLSPSGMWHMPQGCTCATCARRPLPCSIFPQWRHWLFRNSRGRLCGFLAQRCLSCSFTPREVKRRRQNLHLVSLGDGAFIFR